MWCCARVRVKGSIPGGWENALFAIITYLYVDLRPLEPLVRIDEEPHEDEQHGRALAGKEDALMLARDNT